MFRGQLPTVESAETSDHIQTFEEAERAHILHVMELAAWRVRGAGGAAEILGLKPTTLESRMQKLGITQQRIRLRDCRQFFQGFPSEPLGDLPHLEWASPAEKQRVPGELLFRVATGHVTLLRPKRSADAPLCSSSQYR